MARRSLSTSDRSFDAPDDERAMLRDSAPVGLMAILDELFPQVPLALAAPRAAAVVEQVGGQLHGQGSGRLRHRVETRNGVAFAGQYDEEAQACDRGVFEMLEIERAGLGEARDAECFAVRVELAVKDRVTPMFEPCIAQRGNGALGGQLGAARYEP